MNVHGNFYIGILAGIVMVLAFDHVLAAAVGRNDVDFVLYAIALHDLVGDGFIVVVGEDTREKALERKAGRAEFVDGALERVAHA